MSDNYKCRNCGYKNVEGGTTMHDCESVMKATIETLEAKVKELEKIAERALDSMDYNVVMSAAGKKLIERFELLTTTNKG